MTAHVDTLKLATRLEAGGFSGEQARTMAAALGEAAGSVDVVTKADMTMALLLLEQRLTIRLGAMMVTIGGLLLAASHYLH